MALNPYPEGWAAIVGFAYETPLWLARGIAAVKTRRGADAEYILARPYGVRYRRAGEGWRRLTVPAGLATDLASVPAAARPLIGRVGPHLEASIVHDYLYVAWQDVPGRGARAHDRAFADALLLAGMAEAGVDAVRRRLIYRAVRLFGAGAYLDPNPARYAPLPA